MALPNVLSGNKLKVFIEDTTVTPDPWLFICIAQEASLSEAQNFEEAYLPDCASPDDIPSRTSRPTGSRWDLTLNAYLDPDNVAFKKLRSSYAPSNPVTVRVKIVENRTGAATKTGYAYIEGFDYKKSGAGLTKCDIKLRGEGALVVTTTA